ncbi:MAG: amino acid ABC transporter substrate-binding protein [Gammaproteobacteria bacterium]|nr:amino acid ABC transporter substrate-binding protein [Gammaproteobacteria bacterium]
MLIRKLVTWFATIVAVLVFTPLASAENLYGTLKKISDSGTIVVGHRESSVPFAYLNDDQKPEGYSIDLCMRIVDRVSERVGKKLEVKLVPVNPKTRIPLLANGTIDIECGSTTNNLTRQQQVDYAHTTFITGTKVLVKKGTGVKEVEDLKGKSIALAQGTTNERAIKAIDKEKGLGLKVLPVKDHAEGFLALDTGRVDAYATDHILLYGLISKAKNPDEYEVVGRFLSYDPYGIMVRRDDSAFRLVANTTLSDLFRSGEINDIYAKWFDPLGVPQTDLLKAAFEMQALPY